MGQMEIDESTLEQIKQANTTRHGTWLYHASGMWTSALLEDNGEVIAPEAILMLDLYTVDVTAEGLMPQETTRVFLRMADLCNIGDEIGRLMLMHLMPEMDKDSQIIMFDKQAE